MNAGVNVSVFIVLAVFIVVALNQLHNTMRIPLVHSLAHRGQKKKDIVNLKWFETGPLETTDYHSDLTSL